MRRLLASAYRTGASLEQTDAFRIGEAAFLSVALVTFQILRRFDGAGRWSWGLDHVGIIAAGLGLIGAAALTDGIPGYWARNIVGHMFSAVWLGIGLRIGTGQGSIEAALTFGWWMFVLAGITFVLGGGEFASSHPFLAGLWSWTNSSRGNAVDVVRQLADLAKTDERARQQLATVAVGSIRALAATGDEMAITATLDALVDLAKTKAPTDFFGATSDAHSRAEAEIVNELRGAWKTGDHVRIKALMPRVIEYTTLPAGTEVKTVESTALGTTVVVLLPFGVGASHTNPEEVQNNLAWLLSIAPTAIEITPGTPPQLWEIKITTKNPNAQQATW